MYSVISSVAANPTGACNAVAYNIPIQDAACALANVQGTPSNYSDIMSKCCGAAPVEKYANDCASYCLASGQSAGSLIECLQKEGAKPGDIFCNANNTASATGKVSSSGSGTSKPTGTQGGTAAGASSTGSQGAAPGLVTPQVVSKAGLSMLAMLFISAAAGALM
ncbi:hypothetical protein K469DRAFT_747568 [Zopfia rhizophila CBS 207.26]|uniref:Uncharacterized protein n=1 Tax=Zopfia rhizophila CBS 207.26 TaxID=1314779 RepID=A0A6A6EEK9_9PEZI|nr:hypothetical protein K469DRAFT_747568 [Zopfia rhizophila CBS 207.26]